MQDTGQNLSGLAPVIRGLLAKPTGNQDIPYEPVILKSLTDKEAVNFTASVEKAKAKQYPAPLTKGPRPPLFLDPGDFSAEPEKLYHQLNEWISDYSKHYNSKPDILCLRKLGILYIDRKDDNSDLPLKNKVALVTGSAGAIGYGICKGLLENGCFLAAT
ncbi:MAG: SDR family oxidoreductase, partial [Planctomycetota bacterium]